MFNCHIKQLLIIILLAITQVSVNGSVIVRMEFQREAVTESVDIKLFNELAPATVSNFLTYTGDGDYSDSFIHRVAAGFVIQGGGYTFDPLVNDGTFSYDMANDSYPGGLQQVPEDPPIQNEFGKSNTRGTFAMAKLGGDPDSATSQWFINLIDNSSNLDNQNGGFTVFGEVIGNGMSVIDSAATTSVFNKTDIQSAFGALPLINYTSDPIVQDNLVRINSINKLISITTSYSGLTVVSDTLEPEDVDYGIIVNGETVVADTEITNLSSDILSIGNISDIDSLSTPFVITSNTCANSSLMPTDSCVISIEYSPTLEGVFEDGFNIEFTSINLSYILDVRGESSANSPVSDIAVSSNNLEFVEVQLYNPSQGAGENEVVTITNTGNLDLNIYSIHLSGIDANEFNLNDTCAVHNPLKRGESCDLQVFFKPLSIGNKSALLVISSDDPVENILNIGLTGSASIDDDGVPALIEDMAPNNGDGNNDGVLDSAQNNVLSIKSTDGNYLTFVINEENNFVDFSLLEHSQLINPPSEIDIDSVFRLSLQNKFIIFGIYQTEIGLILPNGIVPTTFYMFGPTPDDINPHWYEFEFDGITGTQVFGNVSINLPSGATIQRSVVKLVLVDGLRGDSDLSVNGIIDVQGSYLAPKTATNTDSGIINPFAVLILLFYLVYSRTRRKVIS